MGVVVLESVYRGERKKFRKVDGGVLAVRGAEVVYEARGNEQGFFVVSVVSVAAPVFVAMPVVVSSVPMVVMASAVPVVMAMFVLPVPVMAVVVVSVVVMTGMVVIVVVFVVSVRHACESVRQGYTSRDFTNSSEISEFL